MKSLSIFAVRTPNSYIRFIVGTDIFLFSALALAVRYKAIPSCGHLYLISHLFEFGDSEGGSLSFIEYLNFSFMPNSMKNVSTVNSSICTNTSTGTKSVSINSISRIKKSNLTYRVAKSRNVPKGCFFGETSHFTIDTNTMDEVLRTFYQWAIKGDSEKLIANLNNLKSNI